MHGIHILVVLSLLLPHISGVRLPLRRRSISSGVPMKSTKSSSIALDDLGDKAVSCLTSTYISIQMLTAPQYTLDIRLGGHGMWPGETSFTQPEV